MSKELKKYECKVIRSGMIVNGTELEIGHPLQLTERQITAFSGKVKLIKEINKEEANEEKSLKGIAKLKEANDKLEEALGEKTMEVKRLTAELAAAKKK